MAFEKLSRWAKVGKGLWDNKENLIKANELKDKLADVIEDGTKFVKKISQDKNAMILADIIGAGKHVFRGNNKKVFSHYLTDSIDTVVKVNPTDLDDYSIILPQHSDFEVEETIQLLQKEKVLIEAVSFNKEEHTVTSSYGAKIHNHRYLGNKELFLSVEAVLVEQNSEQSMHLTISLVDVKTGKKIINEVIRVELEDIKFKVDEKSLPHVTLPVYLLHYLSINDDNQVELHFVLA